MQRFNLSRRSVISGLAGLPLVEGASAQNPLRVSVADFGVRPDVLDVGPGVRAAIARLDKQAGSTLHFPPGTYRFNARDGVAMLFDDIENLTVEGDGATLLFNGAIAPVRMFRCRGPVLKGLTFDWERPPFSQGEVIAVGLDQKSLTLRIDPEFPVDGSEKIGQLGTYDRVTRAMTAGGIDDGGSVASVSLVAAQTLHLTLKRPVPFRVGDTVVARHGEGPHVIVLNGCHDFSIENLAIYASPAMAIACGGCEGGSINRVSVQQKPGSGRIMSTNQDALHCASCSGRIDIADCTFTGMGDDGVNVTGLYLAVESDPDQGVLTLSGGHRSPAPIYAAPHIADHLLLVSGRTLKPIAELDVQVVDAKEGGRWLVKVSKDHAVFVGDPVFAIDLQARTQLIVSRCEFGGNRARGVLAHSDAIIENCLFVNQSDSAILLAPDMFWQEGPAVDHTVVRDNRIQTSNLLGRVPAAIWISAFVSPDGRQEVPTPEVVNHNVTVEHNRFVKPNGPAVAAVSTGDLKIDDNQIDQAASVAFDFQNVRSVRLSRNRCDPAAKVRLAQSSAGELKMEANIGLQAQ